MKSWSRGRLTSYFVVSLFPGLAALAHAFALSVRERWQNANFGAEIYSWAVMPPEPKIQHMVEYVTLTGAAGAVMVAGFLYVLRHPQPLDLTRRNRWALGTYLAALLLMPALFEINGLLVLWLLLAAALPAYLVGDRGARLEARLAQGSRPLYVAVCATLLALVVAGLYATLWNPTLRFVNDYAQLPEQTLLSTGQWVDNQAFMREHAIPGGYPADPCRDEVPQGACIEIPRAAFTSVREPFDLFPPGTGLNYSWDDQKLRAYRKPNERECLLLEALAHSKQRLCNDSDAKANTAGHSALVAEFRQKNRYEIDGQSQLGRFFFHHAYLYLPVMQVANGLADGASALPAQYGFGLSRVMGHLVRWFGGVNFQDYFFVYWFGPGLYVVLTALVVLLVTRRAALAVSAAALVIGLLPFRSLDGLRLAPGFNPWRHLPDVLCLLAVAMFARLPRLQGALLRAVATGVMFWWNREFGLFLLAASGVWYFFGSMNRGRRQAPSALWWFLELGACVVAFWLSTSSGSNELAFYNLLGVGAPKTRWRNVPAYALAWLALIACAAWARFVRSPDPAAPDADNGALDAAGVGFCYVAFGTVYGLWNPSPGHWSVVWICSVVPLLCLFHVLLPRARAALGISGTWLQYYVTLTLTLLVVFSSVTAMTDGDGTVQGQFANHKTYAWQLPGLAGTSTADPTPVREAIALINREQPRGAVMLLSRYDVLLHTASSRQSILPYVDIPSALIGWNVIESLRRQVEERKPGVIFMDRDVMASWEWQMLALQPMLEVQDTVDYKNIYKQVGIAAYGQDAGLIEGEAPIKLLTVLHQRTGHLSALGLLARLLSTCYAPGATGGVLQAWHRTCS